MEGALLLLFYVCLFLCMMLVVNADKKLVRDGFNQKRKSIKNNLKGYDLVKIEEVLKDNNKDLNIRAEDIDVDLFIKMANRIG